MKDSRVAPQFIPKICVIGRDDFTTGIGKHTHALLELLSRHFQEVFFHPKDVSSAQAATGVLSLPSGREVPIAESMSGFDMYIFADVLWNGARDTFFDRFPKDGTKIAFFTFDGDEVPREWVSILNSKFDGAVLLVEPLLEVARRSGVRIPMTHLPLALDLEESLSVPYTRPNLSKIRFGTLSAFHPRKNLKLLVAAFNRVFAQNPNIELAIHSNLSHPGELAAINRLTFGAPGIEVTSHSLSESEKNAFLESIDVYINISSGEGFSIGPREALAYGKPLVISDLSAHRELNNAPGVVTVSSSRKKVAVYPEIDSRAYGHQQLYDVDAICQGLDAALNYLHSGNSERDVFLRRMLGAKFSFTSLEQGYRGLVVRDENLGSIPEFLSEVYFSGIEKNFPRPIQSLERSYGKKIIVPMHDGGFFSIFNVYLSHLVWGLQNRNIAYVIPDWDVNRFLTNRNGEPPVSFCYGQPQDGNVWTKLFEPPYDLSSEDLNQEEFLYTESSLPDTVFNQDREPLLTYVHAAELYQASWFGEWRAQYNSVFRSYVRLIAPLQDKMERLLKRFDTDSFTIGIHVKHPSHSIEQPNGVMPNLEQYIERVRQLLLDRGLDEISDDWAIFLATDQDIVVREFESEFPGRILLNTGVSRIDEEVDLRFSQLEEDERRREGHQLQHLVANSPQEWSWKYAWDVFADVECLAACDIVIHSVSNVATAVAYFNPTVEMDYFHVD